MPPDVDTRPDGAPATPPVAGPDPLATSRQLKEAGVDLNSVDWMARYNGAVGAFRQQYAALSEENERLKQENILLKSQFEATKTQITDLQTKTAGAADIQKQLDEAKQQLALSSQTIEKAKLLMEFPDLLRPTGQTGASNPFVELVMSSTLPGEELRKQLPTMANLLQQKAPPVPGPSAPPSPPQVGAEQQNDPAYWRRQADEWHQKFLDSHQTDMEASAKEQDAWDNWRRAKRGG